jgi:hypothetical protein
MNYENLQVVKYIKKQFTFNQKYGIIDILNKLWRHYERKPKSPARMRRTTN